MTAYLLQVIGPFLEKDHLKEAEKALAKAAKRFAEFGNMMLLEPTTWEWHGTHNKEPSEDYIMLFPGFRQVRDKRGVATEGRWDTNPIVNKVLGAEGPAT